MAATVIDSLLITLGVDASQAKGILQALGVQIQQAGDVAQQFADGLKEGLNDAETGADGLATTTTEAADAMTQGFGAVVDVLDKINTKLDRTKHNAHDTGKKIGGFLGSALKKVKALVASSLAPLAAMVALGSLFKGYSSDLSELDELTRKNSLSMEERARKQKLLAEYSKKDLEQYQKLKKAQETFTKGLREGAASIMTAVAPALVTMIEGLGKLLKFVKDHKELVIGFFAGIAAIIALSLIPTIKKLEFTAVKAGWAMMRPWLPWIAALGIASVLLEDVWFFINGNGSAIENLARSFGASNEQIEKWRDKLKSCLEFLKEWWPQLAVAGALFLPLIKAISFFNVVPKMFGMVSKTLGFTTIALKGVATGLRVMGAAGMALARGFIALLILGAKGLSLLVGGLKLAASGIRMLVVGIRLLGAAIIANPIVLVIMAIVAAIALCIYYWDNIKNVAVGAWDAIAEKWGAAGDWFGEKVDSIKAKFQTFKNFLVGLIPDWLKDLLGIDGGKGIEATLSEAKGKLGEAIANAIPSVGDVMSGISNAGSAIKNFGAGIAGDIGRFFGGGASEAVSPALAAGTTQNNSETNIESINVISAATDANGIAKDIGPALQRETNKLANTASKSSH